MFGTDSSPNVRSGALEICGELVYLFQGDPVGVPPELLAFFLGQSEEPRPAVEPSDGAFAPLSNALDFPPTFLSDGPMSLWSDSNTASLRDLKRDPDRPVMWYVLSSPYILCYADFPRRSAFNFPSVVLTLGREKWPCMRDYHLALCRDKTSKVRQSLASSLFEIAKIIGPAQADESLFEPFEWFLHDFDQVQGALLENVSTLLLSFGDDAARRALALLQAAWGDIKTWRMREAIAKDLARIGPHFINGATEEVLRLLAKAFKDQVAAVREQAVHAVRLFAWPGQITS